MSADEKNLNGVRDINSSQQGEVDVDKMRVKVLILCQNRARLDNIASFLNRRGWESIVISKIEQAIKILASDSPDFVMISMNHANKKVSVLPTFISQTFKTKCIVFGEQSDSKTIGTIHAAKAEYKMMGMISGPSVHRKIKQILNDIYNKKPESHNSFGTSSHENSNVITIGEPVAKSTESGIQRFSQESRIKSAIPKSAAEQVREMSSNSETAGVDSHVNQGAFSQSGFGSVSSKESKYHENDSNKDIRGFESNNKISNFSITNKNTHSPISSGQTEDFSSTQRFQTREVDNVQLPEQEAIERESYFQKSEPNQGDGFEIEKERQEKASNPMLINKGTRASGMVLNKGEGDDVVNNNIVAKNKAKSGINFLTEKPKVTNSSIKNSTNESNESSSLARGRFQDFGAIAGAENKKQNFNDINGKFETSKNKPKRKRRHELDLKKSILKEKENNKKQLFNAISKSIGSICEKPEEMICPVDLVTTVFIVPVKGEKNTGFLLVGASDVIHNEEEFLRAFQKQVEKNINLGEADYFVDKTVKCHIEEVSFYEFCKNTGDFTIVEITGETEICVTFIPFGNPIPEIKQRLGHIKSEIDVKTLPVDKEFTFNTYLHLRKNKKYFLFMKKGNFFLEKQRDRLLSKNVPLYISREDTDEYKYFYMRNHVQDFIEHFISQNNLVAAI